MTDDLVMDRRRALLLAGALATIWAAERTSLGMTEAAKKKKSKGKTKKKKSKKGKSSNKQSTGGSGQEIVRVAKKYEGYPYVWAGASPKGFDCSGFTWYVYDKAAGMDIGRTVPEQYKQGKSVSKGSWKAGDIVFFKNTFEKGLSHCGIYISGDKFIHAENESTGVVISSLASGYYKDHYAGARRLV